MLSIENNQIMMEHYTDVISVSSTKVQIGFKGYQLQILGSDLKILALASSEIYMAGKLESIAFLYEK